jgi:hypothetical protein
MDLDDLKQSWQQTPTTKTTNTDIMQLIQQKSYGPIAAMKEGYRKQIIFMSLLPFILVLTNMNDVAGVFRSVMFWSYVAFCIGVIALAITNYRTVTRMEGMDGLVRTKLEQQIQTLEMRLKQTIVGIRIVMIYFIVLTEVLPYIQHYHMLDHWHSLPWYARYAAYAVLLLLQYIFSRRIADRKFGRHLTYLKSLVKELQ